MLCHQDGAEALVAQLLHGSGLRLVPAASAQRLEALRLRIKDVDLEQRRITVRCGSGDKDRRSVLPSSLVEPLQRHMQGVRGVHQADLKAGWGVVELRHVVELRDVVKLRGVVERNYRNAVREWAW
ncbi:MAG: hypothetical protein VKO26_05385 [Cyanobacteriota bacterium]|nr:hypothetical protein [Cyanobacteriota bacterium]